MVIQNMFVEDINRKINGVVKVDEDENKVLEQELNEYVITRELKRHFADFFNNLHVSNIRDRKYYVKKRNQII